MGKEKEVLRLYGVEVPQSSVLEKNVRIKAELCDSEVARTVELENAIKAVTREIRKTTLSADAPDDVVEAVKAKRKELAAKRKALANELVISQQKAKALEKVCDAYSDIYEAATKNPCPSFRKTERFEPYVALSTTEKVAMVVSTWGKGVESKSAIEIAAAEEESRKKTQEAGGQALGKALEKTKEALRVFSDRTGKAAKALSGVVAEKSSTAAKAASVKAREAAKVIGRQSTEAKKRITFPMVCVAAGAVVIAVACIMIF